MEQATYCYISNKQTMDRLSTGKKHVYNVSNQLNVVGAGFCLCLLRAYLYNTLMASCRQQGVVVDCSHLPLNIVALQSDTCKNVVYEP